jgi:hypothetical protein
MGMSKLEKIKELISYENIKPLQKHRERFWLLHRFINKLAAIYYLSFSGNRNALHKEYYFSFTINIL